MSSLLFHNRLYNRYSLITVISIFAVLVLSWFFVSGLGEVLFMDYSAPDLGGRDHAEVRAEIKRSYYSGKISNSSPYL